jgi:aminodeoxyfutalosine deaminase
MTLTNAHTHLELGWAADYCPGIAGEHFIPWITGLVQRRIALGDYSAAAHRNGVISGIQQLLDCGTTHVGDISFTGESIPLLLESGLAGVVYVEVFGTNPNDAEPSLARARRLIDEWRPQERNGMRVGLTIHAPYSTHRKLWEIALDYCRREALPLCIHAAESPEEWEFMTKGTGPMLEFQAKLGTPMDSPRMTSIQYLNEIGALDLKPLLVHMVHVTDSDIEIVRQRGCTVANCPRSNFRLRCGRMPLEKYLAAEIPVVLGTDSLSSSPSLDVREEAEFDAAWNYEKVDPAAIEALLYREWVG